MAIRKFCRWAGLLCVLALLAVRAPAEDADPLQAAGLLQMHHTAWSTRDGAPGPVLAIAQTPDGRLWLGTLTGLFTYDGVGFTHVGSLGGTPLPASAIRCLTTAPDGTLWIGYLFGGASRYAAGRLTNYGPVQGLPNATLARIAVDPGGGVWAAAVHGLYKLAGERWVRAVPERDMVLDVFVDHASRVWFLSRERLWVYDPGTPGAPPRDLAPAPWDDALRITEGPDGAVWLADAAQGLRRFNSEGALPAGPATPRGPAAPLLFDRDGMAWVAGNGVRRSDPRSWARPPDKAPAGPSAGFDQRAGLSGQEVYALFQDREGSVWVGTSGGLDRFRRNKLTRVFVSLAQTAALAPAAGGVWVGRGSDLPLMRLGERAREVPAVRGDVWTLFTDDDGSLWAGSSTGRIWHVVGDAATPFPSPKPLGQGHVVQAFTRDRSHRLWVSCADLFRWDGDHWTALGGRDGLPDDAPTELHTDAEGRVWIGYAQSRLAVYEQGRGRTFGREQGLDVGTVLALASVGGHLWIGGESGVAVRTPRGFSRLVGAGGAAFYGVSGVVEEPDGELWLNGADGLVRIAAAEAKRFLDEPGYQPAFEVFDHRDGLDGRAAPLGPRPTMASGLDGRLWISTPNSIASIHPGAIPRNTQPAPVSILGLKTGDQQWPPGPGVTLPPLTTSLQVQYTAFSLALPERVRFRYRLEGVDAQWQEAGTRRTAYYTNLGPGTFHFAVQASNEDGVWSEQPATLEFAIRPALYQTSAFRIACALVFLALLAVLYRLRVRTLTARAAEKTRERHAERERIAGELHDTLLQGTYGLLMKMQTVLDQVGEELPRRTLSHAVEQAEQLINEGRDRVAGLRHAARHTEDLPRALRRLVHEMSGTAGTRVVLAVEGDLPLFAPEVQEEVFFIVREALLNSLRHAHATTIRVELAGDSRDVRVDVLDDGVGIPGDVLARGGKPGHWGLQGMRDRAERIGAALKFTLRPGGGTDLSLRLPRARAGKRRPLHRTRWGCLSRR